MLTLVEDLRALSKRDLRLPSEPKSLSTSSLKGIIQRTLDQYPFLLVLDHLSAPSRVVTGMVKEMNYYGRNPVFFAALTLHMEDIGTLQPMCADRSERVEIKNLTPSIALEFAQRECEKTGLWASNLEHALHSPVGWSEGNPGEHHSDGEDGASGQIPDGRPDQGACVISRSPHGPSLTAQLLRHIRERIR